MVNPRVANPAGKFDKAGAGKKPHRKGAAPKGGPKGGDAVLTRKK